MSDLTKRLLAILDADDDDDVQQLTPTEPPLEIKIEDYNEEPPKFKAKPAEIKAWSCWRHWYLLWRFLNDYNQRNYGDVLDYRFLYAVGYDKENHRAIFALDEESYYAIDFDEEDKLPIKAHETSRVLIRLRLIGEEFYRLNSRPLRVEVVKPPETDIR